MVWGTFSLELSQVILVVPDATAYITGLENGLQRKAIPRNAEIELSTGRRLEPSQRNV